jgi:hypothetical protein
VHGFDVAVCLRAAGADAADADAVDGDRTPEALGAEFLAVVGEHALEPPAGRFQLAGDAADKA